MSLFLTIVNTLAVFDIRKQIGQDGVEIVPEVRYSGGVIRFAESSSCGDMSADGVCYSHPLPFPFKVTPRSEKALALLKTVD